MGCVPTEPTSEANAAQDLYHVEADSAVTPLVVPISSPNDPFANDVVRNTALPDYIPDDKNHIVDTSGIGVSVAPTPWTDAGHYVATPIVVESCFSVSAFHPELQPPLSACRCECPR